MAEIYNHFIRCTQCEGDRVKIKTQARELFVHCQACGNQSTYKKTKGRAIEFHEERQNPAEQRRAI